MIRIKRAYAPPEGSDGVRFLLAGGRRMPLCSLCGNQNGADPGRRRHHRRHVRAGSALRDRRLYRFRRDSSPTRIWSDTWRGLSPGRDEPTISGHSTNLWPFYNDRAVVCIPAIDGQCASLTERGVTAIAEQTFRINSRVKLELGALLFRADHPETDLLMIEPSPAESSLFLYGSMNFAERVHSLNYGYNSSVHYFIENFDRLQECFARHGMDVSLERLSADRFLQQSSVPGGRRRFGLKRQQSKVPAR